MPRIPVLALAIAVLLLSPARGQDAEEIEELIAQLGDEDELVRRDAISDLIKIGPLAVPALIAHSPARRNYTRTFTKVRSTLWRSLAPRRSRLLSKLYPTRTRSSVITRPGP